MLAPMTVRVLVPEGVDCSGSSAACGLEGVVVYVDGKTCGTTNENGACTVVVRAGKRQVHLKHDWLGIDGRSLSDVEVTKENTNECTVFTDVRIFLWASYAE